MDTVVCAQSYNVHPYIYIYIGSSQKLYFFVYIWDQGGWGHTSKSLLIPFALRQPQLRSFLARQKPLRNYTCLIDVQIQLRTQIVTHNY